MAKVLYITANVKEVKDSYSLAVGEAFMNAYKENNPNDEIISFNLFDKQPPSLDGAIIGCMFGQIKKDDLNDEDKKRVDTFYSNLDEFMSADKYVFAVPLWNLASPDIVKTYFDNVCVAGKTFKYTESGPVGLLKGKKAVCIQASGGVYSTGPAAELEHGVSYIKSGLTFLGIEVTNVIYVEGVNIQTNDTEKIKVEAIEEARNVAKEF